MPDTLIVSLDLGTSSVRTVAFDETGRLAPGFGKRRKHGPSTTPGGGAEFDAARLAASAEDCLQTIHDQIHAAHRPVAAVAMSTFWHCFLGVGRRGTITTPLIHLFDTRSAAQADRLKQQLGPDASQRTGCPIHTSYWPAKLLWLHEQRSGAFSATARWLSPGEFFFLKWFGEPRASTSMVSASGLWNQRESRYDAATLAALPVSESQLASVDGLDEPATKLRPACARRWPAFDGIPWFPAIGDGACNNVGTGCVTPDRFALMVGTSGAMRVVNTEPPAQIPNGLWCYRVDRQRAVTGGALSNGGNVFEWMTNTLRLPKGEELERRIAAPEPGEHGLRVLPFLSGERSPYWRADFDASILGMRSATKPEQILRAALESVALRFSQIYSLLTPASGVPKEVIASGRAMTSSPAWAQMMADALGRPLLVSDDDEPSARGAALLALERLGVIADLAAVPPETGASYAPKPGRTEIYQRMLLDQQELIALLFPKP